jgi:nicotinamide mononucleotide adenylyltransferase
MAKENKETMKKQLKNEEELEVPKKKIGIVIGRFQVDLPTLAHNYLINYAKERCDEVLILVGTRENIDYKNILNFKMRSDILKQIHHECYIKPITDIDGDDVAWSLLVDNTIKETITTDFGVSLDEYSVVLFGGRDSYINYYFGEYKDSYIEVDSPEYASLSASEERERIAEYDNTINDPSFRRGVIWGVMNYIKQQENGNR